MKGNDKYIIGYDQYINAHDKYTKDFLQKIFTAMTNIFTAMPKKYLRLLCPLYQWSVELARQNGGGGGRLIYWSNRSFNIPPPPPGHLTPFSAHGVGNLITSLDIMLRVALIPRGLMVAGRFARCPVRPESFHPDWESIRPEYEVGNKLWWIQKKRLRICGGLVENQRPAQALFCI